MSREPFAARLHFITRFTSRAQGVIVRLLRRYFVRAPSWLLLPTRGRRTGLPREPRVRITCTGWVLPARAEIVDDLETKRSLVTAHPFFPPLPVFPLNLIDITLLRPLTIAFLRWWVTHRPVVWIHPVNDVAARA